MTEVIAVFAKFLSFSVFGIHYGTLEYVVILSKALMSVF